jgi:hypothetical protein
MLVSTAAIPRRNDPSIITIADSFPALYVRYMFSCRKEGFCDVRFDHPNSR